MREVRIRRSERSGTSDPWPRPTTQTITTSFDISDVVAFCDAAQNVGTLWVAGTYETGLATIEKWTATAGGPGGAGAGAVTFVKTAIFQGDEMGSIASIAPDPQGRFAELALAKSMVRSDHPVEGPKYLLYAEPKRSWRVMDLRGRSHDDPAGRRGRQRDDRLDRGARSRGVRGRRLPPVVDLEKPLLHAPVAGGPLGGALELFAQ